MTTPARATGALLALLLLAATACSPDTPATEAPTAEKTATAEKPATPQKPAAQPAAPPATPAPDDRSAAQFAADWLRVRQAPVEQQGAAGKAMRDSWHNRIYTWTGYAVPGLCLASSHSCALHVFERRTTAKKAMLDGYFPQVRFGEQAYAALVAACKGKTGCVVTFRGTLTETETDPAEALRLRFADATFVSARDPAPDEQWFGRRASDKPPRKVPNARLRTGAPVKGTIKPIRRTF